MKLIASVILLILVHFHESTAQSPLSAKFLFPESPYEVCLQEPLNVSNLSENAEDYLWDFCLEDYTEPPVLSDPLNVNGLVNGWGYRVVRNGSQWTGFIVSRNTNKVFRLDFGDDPLDTPVIVDLGNPGNLLVSPQGLDIVKQDGKWYAFIGKGETTSGQLVRLDFGDNLSNIPTASGLGTFGVLGRLRDVKVARQGEDWILLVVQDTGNALMRINYRDSFSNTILSEHISSTGTLPGASLPVGFSVVKHGGSWIVHTASYGNNAVQQYNFGSDIFGTPALEGSFTFPSVTRPFFVKLIREGDSFYGFIANESKNISIVNFGDLRSEPFELDNSALPRYIGFDVAKSESRNLIQGVVTGTSTFRQVSFENETCTATAAFSTEASPDSIAFSSPGSYTIELLAENGGMWDVTSGELAVSTTRAPSLEILTDGICIESAIQFSASSDSPLQAWSWQFGDGNSSSEGAPSHLYTEEGDYMVNLEVADGNDCRNRQTYALSVYSAPVSDFSLPETVLCTNNAFTLNALTPDIFNGNLSYQWSVGGVPVSTDRNLNHTFLSTGISTISLRTSIAGCSDELTKTTAPVVAGPRVDFSFDGSCEDESFSFRSLIPDPYTSLKWSFGNGDTSLDKDPDYIFENFGDYAVSLSVTNAAGCETTESTIVTVGADPIPDFTVDGPPNACAGSATHFTNLTAAPDGAELTEWLWAFDDSGATSGDADPDHTYDEAGTYTVSMSATTASGCASTLTREIAINPSPTSTFTSGAQCINVPGEFTSTQILPIVDWYWEVGTAYYREPSPEHTFKAAGDYPVLLEMTASNGCQSAVNTSVHIPEPAIPAFSITSNCAGVEAILTDMTTGEDPVTSRLWDVGDGALHSEPTLAYTFPAPGEQQIVLEVMTAHGCVYQTSREVDIVPAPQAGFSADFYSGAWPLEVSFTNTSSHASTYSWKFNDGTGTVSTDESPVYVFEDPGSFDVSVTASNELGCSDTFSGAITTVAPQADVALEMLSLAATDDGSTKIIITVYNKGNTVVKGLPLTVDFGGTLTLREIVREMIPPGTRYNHVFSAGLLDATMLRYMCATAELPGDIDERTNQICDGLTGRLLVFPVYPNPASGKLHLAYMAAAEEPGRILVTDLAGRIVVVATFTSLTGYNQHEIDLQGLGEGLYLLQVQVGGSREIQRIQILH